MTSTFMSGFKLLLHSLDHTSQDSVLRNLLILSLCVKNSLEENVYNFCEVDQGTFLSVLEAQN